MPDRTRQGHEFVAHSCGLLGNNALEPNLAFRSHPPSFAAMMRDGTTDAGLMSVQMPTAERGSERKGMITHVQNVAQITRLRHAEDDITEWTVLGRITYDEIR